MDRFPFDQLVDFVDGLGSQSSLPSDSILCRDIDILRDLPTSERRKWLKRAKREALRRLVQSRVDEIAEAAEANDASFVSVLMEAFPSDLNNFYGLGAKQKSCWLLQAELAANGLSDSDDRGELIYFVSGDGAHVKIGFTTNLSVRLSTLQTGSSQKLKILLAHPGSREVEAELHKRFSSDRTHGEWFRLSAAIHRYIASMKVDYC